MNEVAVRVCVQFYVWIYIFDSKSLIIKSYDNSMFSYVRNHKNIFQK